MDEVGSGAAKPPRARPNAKIDLYKVRAEHFARDLERLRQIEWRVLFQLYVGYAAVLMAYSSLREQEALRVVAGVTAVLLTLLLFWTTFSALLKLYRRLDVARRMHRAYLEEIHLTLRVPELSLPPGGTAQEDDGFFIVQIILSSVVGAVLIAYVVATTLASM